MADNLKNDDMLCVRVPVQTKQRLWQITREVNRDSEYKVTLSQVVSRIINEHLEKRGGKK